MFLTAVIESFTKCKIEGEPCAVPINQSIITTNVAFIPCSGLNPNCCVWFRIPSAMGNLESILS